MTTTSPDWASATRAVEAASSLVLITHVDPDGDAIGSLVGLANALRERGKAVTAVVDGGVPGYLRYIPGSETVLPALTEGEWELMISLDASDEGRTGQAGVYGRAHSRAVMNIDHHPTNTLFGGLQLVAPTAVSTSEILLAWLLDMGHLLTRAVAVPLLTGLVTDTRGFRTSNVSASTLAAAQRLVEAGASITEITARTLDSLTYGTLLLWKFVLPSVELHDGVISANITQADAKGAGVNVKDDGSLVSTLVAVDQAMISVVFTELVDGQIEIGLRSKPGYDVSQVAFSLGGGGHRQASGATVAGPLDAARARVLPLLAEAARTGTLTIA